MSKPSFAFLFYSLNMTLFLVGVHFWLAYSTLRIAIIYPIFNVILFRLSTRNHAFVAKSRDAISSNLFRFLTVTFVLLLSVITAGTYQSLYEIPLFVIGMLGMATMLFVVILLNSTRLPAFKESFALPAAISLVLLAYYGTFLAQPNLSYSPPYATVDAYRDYANAAIVLSLSRVDPEKIILTPYFRAFPVVPLEISSVSLLSGLPLNISHLILAMIAQGTAVTSLFLLSKRIAGNHTQMGSCLAFLSTLLVLLQPAEMEPSELVEPLRISIPIITLILYLAYTRMFCSAPTRSVFAALVLLIITVIALHGASVMIVILLLSMMTLLAGSHKRSIFARLAVLVIVLWSFYLFFSRPFPFISIVNFSMTVLKRIEESFELGSGFIPELALRLRLGSIVWDEMNSFLLATGRALMLSVLTVFVAKLVEERHRVVADDRQRSFYLILGVVLIFGFGWAFSLAGPWSVDPRYFIVPLTPAAVIATTMVIVWVMGNKSPLRKMFLTGLLSLAVLVALTTPSYLDSSPLHTRLMPIESERAAAMFATTSFDAANGVTQVVSDWPYYQEVQALLYSRHIGINDKVTIPDLMSAPMSPFKETMMLSRRYFMESLYLQAVSPYVKDLSDNARWSHLNRIYDTYSVSIYLGRPSS